MQHRSASEPASQPVSHPIYSTDHRGINHLRSARRFKTVSAYATFVIQLQNLLRAFNFCFRRCERSLHCCDLTWVNTLFAVEPELTTFARFSFETFDSLRA